MNITRTSQSLEKNHRTLSYSKRRMATTKNKLKDLQQRLRQKDEKLPLAILIHYNFYLSFIFAVLVGRLIVEKRHGFYYCNTFQRSLLLPVYCSWFVVEFPRLYLGYKGVLRDKLPEIAAFALLSFFPQVWIVAYLGFMQEIILPFDTVLGTMMMIFTVLELAFSWKLLRSIIARQSSQHRTVG